MNRASSYFPFLSLYKLVLSKLKYCCRINLFHIIRPCLDSVIFYSKIIELLLSLTLCDFSAPNFEISPRKCRRKKIIVSASFYIGRFHSLIRHVFSNYEGTKVKRSFTNKKFFVLIKNGSRKQ